MIWCVALALRPLSFGELGHMLAYIDERARARQHSCHAGIRSENQPRTETDIRIYVRSSVGFLRANTETVSIVHHTAIEYLFDQNRKDNLPVLSKSEANSQFPGTVSNTFMMPFGTLGGSQEQRSGVTTTVSGKHARFTTETDCERIRKDPGRRKTNI